MSKIALVLLSSAAASLMFGGVASASNLVSNGGFEATTNGAGQLGFNTDATGWSVPDPNAGASYTFLYTPGSADTSGANGVFGNVGIWGPNNGSANGLPATSPSGGNFIASDPQFNVGPVTQTINGLTAGAKYNLSFEWAGAQQSGFDGPTSEGWQASLGSETHSTSILDIASHGFTGWQDASFTFTATSSSEVLSFLAMGGPNGSAPPFALLDNVSLTGGVPEPATWAIMLVGFGGMGAAIRSRRKQAAATA